MQSFTQWKQAKRYIDKTVQFEQNTSDYYSSTYHLNIVKIPTPSLDYDDFLQTESNSSSRATRYSASNMSQRSEDGDWDTDSISRLLQDELGFSLECIKGTDEDENGRPTIFLVENDGGDGCNPRQWPRSRKCGATIIVFLIVFVCGWASAANSSSNANAAEELQVSKEAETLATALFLFVIAFGLLLSGPISETAGRNLTYLIFMLLYMVMVLVTALASNFDVQIEFRFFAGLFSSPPLII
jgi:hypothetical protein